MWKRRAEHRLEEVGGQEAALAAQTQVRRQDVLSDVRAESSAKNATPGTTSSNVVMSASGCAQNIYSLISINLFCYVR